MKILILGSGGREHAIAWKLSQSSEKPELYIAPGNAGTLRLGENVNLNPFDFKSVGQFCTHNHIDMVVVGPEEPLVRGIYDYFKNSAELKDIIITGPSKEGAQLEGSKSFAKAFMKRHGIPTAGYREFNHENFEEGVEYLKKHPLPIVLKADGLAAGKGVLICQNTDEAIQGFTSMIRESKFGDSGKIVVVEEFLEGIELSVFVCTDGKNYVLFPEAKDYKKIGEGDTGLNTGGMGAVSPVPFADEQFMEQVTSRIIKPTIAGLAADNIDYKGFIFFGLIKVNGEPYVIEYNCRLGDPETEAILLRLKNDLVSIFKAMHTQTLDTITSEFDDNVVLTIMAVSGGYPEAYEKGKTITFNSENDKAGEEEKRSIVFHAGTKMEDGRVVTNGGRVLAVSSLTPDLKESFNLSKETLGNIHFDGIYFRSDIGFEFMG